MKRKTLKIIGLSLLAGVIVGMSLVARPLIDRLVESVAATDQERNPRPGSYRISGRRYPVFRWARVR